MNPDKTSLAAALVRAPVASPLSETRTAFSSTQTPLQHTRVADSTHVPAPSAARAVWLIAAKEFGDRFRNGWVIASAAVWLGAVCLTSFFGLVQIGQMGMQGFDRTVVSLLNLVQYLVPLLGLLMGHDLLVSEREDRTLPLLLSTGLSRNALVAGKFLGGVLTIAFPLILGFVISGTIIGSTAGKAGLPAFIRLALSGLLLGIISASAGLAISTWLHTRVQALVAALLAWCFVVFVFDLAALGLLLAAHAPAAAQEIEVVCDTTHVNAMTDVHAAFDNPDAVDVERSAAPKAMGFSWVLLNPVDLFRAINLATQIGFEIPVALACATTALWIGGLLALSLWKFRSQDL